MSLVIKIENKQKKIQDKNNYKRVLGVYTLEKNLLKKILVGMIRLVKYRIYQWVKRWKIKKTGRQNRRTRRQKNQNDMPKSKELKRYAQNNLPNYKEWKTHNQK